MAKRWEKHKTNGVESNSTACKSKSDCKWRSFSRGYNPASRAVNQNTAIFFHKHKTDYIFFYMAPK